jgi:hypothetical protein
MHCLLEDFVKQSLDPQGYVCIIPRSALSSPSCDYFSSLGISINTRYQFHVNIMTPRRDILLNLSLIGEFRFLQQEDAHEFLIAILGRLQQSFLENLDACAPRLLHHRHNFLRMCASHHLQPIFHQEARSATRGDLVDLPAIRRVHLYTLHAFMCHSSSSILHVYRIRV